MKLSTIPSPAPVENPRCIEINRDSVAVAESLHAGIAALNRMHANFWKGTLPEVVAWLNELGVTQVIAVGVQHNTEATLLNQAFDAAFASALEIEPTLAGRLPQRAIDVPKYWIEGAAIPEGQTASIRIVEGVFEVIPPPEEPEE